jgi:hypothetical protein
MINKIYLVFGTGLIVFGAIGFVENPMIGDGGFFHIDLFHSIVLVLFGVFFIITILNRLDIFARFVKVLCLYFIVVGLLGFFAIGNANGRLFGILTLNIADSVLYILLGATLYFLGKKGGNFSGVGNITS